MQYYLGIDIGKYHHQAILCDPEAKPVGPPLRFETTREGFQALFAYLKTYTQQENFSAVHVGFEATGIYWLTLYEQLLKQKLQISVLNPMQVKAYRNEGIRGAKTDRLDALLLVKVLRFGDYRESDIPDGDLFALRQLTRLRSDLVEMTTKIKLKIVGILDQVFPEYRDIFPDIFGNGSKALLQEVLVPEAITAIPTDKLTILLRQASRGRYGVKQAESVKKAAEETIGIKLGIDAFSIALDILVTQIIHLEKQVERLNAEIETRMTPRGETLTTIPGIGKVQEASIIAEIGDFERFRNDKNGAEKLVAIAGIDPKVKESGRYKGQAKMSKRGSSYLRKTVRQVAFVASLGKNKDPMFSRIYEKKIAEGKPFEVALSHVENKILHVIFSLLKSKKSYKPKL